MAHCTVLSAFLTGLVLESALAEKSEQVCSLLLGLLPVLWTLSQDGFKQLKAENAKKWAQLQGPMLLRLLGCLPLMDDAIHSGGRSS
jgi:hypothetical protein